MTPIACKMIRIDRCSRYFDAHLGEIFTGGKLFYYDHLNFKIAYSPVPPLCA